MIREVAPLKVTNPDSGAVVSKMKGLKYLTIAITRPFAHPKLLPPSFTPLHPPPPRPHSPRKRKIPLISFLVGVNHGVVRVVNSTVVCCVYVQVDVI